MCALLIRDSFFRDPTHLWASEMAEIPLFVWNASQVLVLQIFDI